MVDSKLATGEVATARKIGDEMKTAEDNHTHMLMFYTPKLIVQTLIDCWLAYSLKLYAKALDFILSDDTLVKSATWKDIKMYAMYGKFAEMNWYKKLNEEEQHIVASLVRV